MKKLVLFVMVVLASVNAKANDYPTINVDGKKSFVLALNDWKNQDLFVSILDATGEIMHAEKINQSAAWRKYSLENLPVGTYRLQVADQLKEISFDLFIDYNGVTVGPEKDVHFRPFVTNRDNKLDINLLTINKKVIVNLIDAKGEVLFTENTPVVRKYEKRLDISKLPAGTYTLNMYVGGKLYSEQVSK